MVINDITTTKMEQSKELDVSATNVEVSLRVTTKDPKKVEQAKRLAEFNRKKKEKLARPDKAQESESNLSQAYGVGADIAVWVLGLLGYYIHQRGSPKGDNNDIKVTPVRSVSLQTQKRGNKFEME